MKPKYWFFLGVTVGAILGQLLVLYSLGHLP